MAGTTGSFGTTTGFEIKLLNPPTCGRLTITMADQTVANIASIN